MNARCALLVAPLFVTGCAHSHMPAPYVEESLKSLRGDITSLYDNLIAHAGDAGCEYGLNAGRWMKVNTTVAVLGYRVRARPEDTIMVAPLDELRATIALYEASHQAAAKSPAPRPEGGQNPKCLPAELAAQNSAVLEDGIDNLALLQSTRKELAK